MEDAVRQDINKKIFMLIIVYKARERDTLPQVEKFIPCAGKTKTRIVAGTKVTIQ